MRRARAALATLRIAASHDIALSTLRDAVPSAAGLKLELAFVGSLHALEQFARGAPTSAAFTCRSRRAGAEGRAFSAPASSAAIG